MQAAEIDTPALLVDLDAMERNLRRVADYTPAHGLRLRPHTKTHKSPRMGRRQLESGRGGAHRRQGRRGGSDAGCGRPQICWSPIR